jgi:hypothetical protein
MVFRIPAFTEQVGKYVIRGVTLKTLMMMAMMMMMMIIIIIYCFTIFHVPQAL